MSPPLISVRAELARAAMHFVAKGDCAKAYPERAGVHFRPAPIGVLIVAMDDDAMLVLRDPDGDCDRASTVRIAPSFFKAARRSVQSVGPDRSILNIGANETRLGGVAMPAPEIQLPYPDWKRLIPGRASAPAPAIDPADAERIAIVAGILASMSEDVPGGVRYAAPDARDVVLANFNAWPDAFAVVAPLPEALSAAPWQRPVWTVAAPVPEARAS